MTLRQALASALNQREAALRNGRSKRKDEPRLRAAMGRAVTFLRSYPVASDERVRQWCHEHRDDVAVIVPGNAKGTADALLG